MCCRKRPVAHPTSEQALGADPRWEVLQNAPPAQARAHTVTGAGPPRPQVGVAEPAGQHATHARGSVAQDAAQVGVARVGRVVGWVHAIELVPSHARVLVEQAAALAARQWKPPRHAEGEVALGAEHGGVRSPAERAGDGLELEGDAHEAAGAACTTVKDLPAT
jgi:hypothetical protein